VTILLRAQYLENYLS